MKVTRNVLCLLLLLCLTAGVLTGCLAVSSEAPEAVPSASGEEAAKASEPPVQTPTDPVPEVGWSEAREALVLSLVGKMTDRDFGSDDFTVCGEVGAYTLCLIPYGGDTAVVEDVFAGYRIFSSTIGYPSATHLYLAGDDAIYTLRAAYTQGLIGDMGALYALLPEGMQAGYDPDAEDSFSWEDTDWFGFADGVYRPGVAGWSEAREALVLSLVKEMYLDGGSDDFTVCGEVGAYTLCHIPYGDSDAVVEDVYDGYRIFAPTIGRPSATYLYLVGDDVIYTLRAAYTLGLIEDMGALYALLPEGSKAGYDPDAEDFFSWEDEDLFGFVNGVYRPDVADRSDEREALVRSLTNMVEGWFHSEGETCVDPQVHASYRMYGEVGAYTLCAIYLPSANCGTSITETYGGYSIYSEVVGSPSATHLYLVGDGAIYTLSAAYARGLLRDVGALYALLPADMRAGYDPTAEDVYQLPAGGMDAFGFMDGVYVTLTCGITEASHD